MELHHQTKMSTEQVAVITVGILSSKQAAAITSAQAGVDFQVTVTPLSGQPAPTVSPSGPVTYEDRFIQISSNLFSAIASLCLANPDGSGGCFLSFNESTLGAHSFNWVVSNLSSGLWFDGAMDAVHVG